LFRVDICRFNGDHVFARGHGKGQNENFEKATVFHDLRIGSVSNFNSSSYGSNLGTISLFVCVGLITPFPPPLK
jgi:hypothetical protein